MALKAELRSRTGRRPSGRRAFRAGPRPLRPPWGRRPLQVELLLRAVPSQGPDQAGAARQGGGDLRRAPERRRTPAGGHGAARRRRRADSRQDGAQDDGRGASECSIRGDRPPTGTAPEGKVGETFEERARPRLRRRRPGEDGHRRHRVQVLLRQGLPRARVLRQQEIVAWSVSAPRPRPAGRRCSPCSWRRSRGASPSCTPVWGWQCQHASYVAKLRRTASCRACRAGVACIDNGATEQVFGHLKDEFFRTRLERLEASSATSRPTSAIGTM